MTLQGWNEKLKPYIGKPHNHFAGRCPSRELERRFVAVACAARLGQAGLWRQGRGYACMAGAGCAGHSPTVFYKGRCQGYFGRLLAGGAVCAVGGNPDRYPVRRGGGFAVRVVSRLARIRSGAPYPNAARLPQLGDREEHTKNQPMAAVGDNIRTLHTALTRRGTDSALEWNAGGHFKDADLRTARAFVWVMEGKQ